MSVYEVGRIVVKTHGREAGLHAVVVDVIDRAYVLIDGAAVRRRRCNIKHLVPIPEKFDIVKGADSDDVLAAVKSAGMMEKFENIVEVDL